MENEVENTRRDFMKKFGKYAATAPVGMYMLMTPSSSAATTSGASSCKQTRKQTRRQLAKQTRRQ